LKEFGATRVEACWGDALPDGVDEKFMKDPRMKAMGDMPFNGKRTIYEGAGSPWP